MTTINTRAKINQPHQSTNGLPRSPRPHVGVNVPVAQMPGNAENGWAGPFVLQIW